MEQLALLAVTSDVEGFLSGFDPEQRFVLTIIGIGCSTAIVITIISLLSNFWHKLKSQQIEADLKRDMLDRGMTAEEIQKVIAATPQSSLDRWLDSWTKKW